LANQRPAEFVFSDHVKTAMDRLKHTPKAPANTDEVFAESAE
jgi:hypothetical protein